MNKTQIRIDVELREELKEFGSMGDTYNDVIWNFVTLYKLKDK